METLFARRRLAVSVAADASDSLTSVVVHLSPLSRWENHNELASGTVAQSSLLDLLARVRCVVFRLIRLMRRLRPLFHQKYMAAFLAANFLAVKVPVEGISRSTTEIIGMDRHVAAPLPDLSQVAIS
jgi:hypothetical protein